MSGLTPKLHSIISSAFDKIRSGELKTLIPFLNLFKIGGKPMSLKYHFQFAPMFNTVQAPNTVWMCARQEGKSFQIGVDTHIRASLIPGYHTLIVQPRADQIQRFNGTVFQPLMRSCPVSDAFISSSELSKFALKAYTNGSLVYEDFAFLNPDRIRGASGICSIILDEVQDIEYDFIPIIAETMSASLHWYFAKYTGTPKTTDTTLALLWNQSSQAEWVIKCTHCNYFNVPNPEQDLLKMIGSEGPVCAKCGKLVDPRNGGYVHARPNLALTFPGYHISQPIHPIHTFSQEKWQKLLDKISSPSYSELTLYNEVFGWPFDAATSPLTLSDLLRSVHNTGPIQRPVDVLKYMENYRYITVGVDWGGGGAISDSYTALAVLGLRKESDVIDVLYGKRIPKNTSPTDEAREVLDWIRGTGADAFAFDNGGAGFARLEIMKHEGLMSIHNLTIVPINYVSPRSGDVMRPHPAQREPDMYYYSLDKSRSLAICIMAIKACRIQLPTFSETDETAYQRDFLALREDPSKSVRNETVILIVKKPGVPDDFAHAVNFGCSQIWDKHGAYPKIGTKYDTSTLDYDINNQRIMAEEDFGPRGDFDRFIQSAETSALIMETGSNDDNSWGF